VGLLLAAGGTGGYLLWGEGLNHATGATAGPDGRDDSDDRDPATAAPTGPAATGGAIKPGEGPGGGVAEPQIPENYPADGPGTFGYATTQGPVVGSAGVVRRYRVGVESNIPVAPTDFASTVDSTLSDPRSWIGGGNVRLQRVPPGAPADFTVYLATGGTAGRLCRAGGVEITVNGKPYTSCRVGERVVINLERYFHAVPDYGAPLTVYRQYAINHEVGHALGHGHELCPGNGRPAPVMQQQTLYMQGCTPNQWPYLNGHRYAGPPGKL
jgi:hypothetical protein